MKPPGRPSDEATQFQLQLAHEQGAAADTALQWWMGHACVASARMAAGEYQIALSLRKPRGEWTPSAGALEWRESSGNAWLAVVILDGGDQRPVPGLRVRARIAAHGSEPITQELPFHWGIPLQTYAAPLTLAPGVVDIRIDVDPPAYLRHDPVNGDRFRSPVFAEFVSIAFDPAAIGALADEDDSAIDLALAKTQGDALHRAFAEMAFAVANEGTEVSTGDYRIAYAVEFAETFWTMDSGDLEFFMRPEQSAETNAHVEVAVLDGLTGRFLPGLEVRATLFEEQGSPLGTEVEPFMWHPWIHHYGRNWRVPRSGRYGLRVHVEPPPWPRDGKALGRRFERAVDVEFSNVAISTGQK